MALRVLVYDSEGERFFSGNYYFSDRDGDGEGKRKAEEGNKLCSVRFLLGKEEVNILRVFDFKTAINLIFSIKAR
jgi:hypothetical protein